MDAPTAEIIALDGPIAVLRIDSPVSCARCAAGKGCGAGLIGRQPLQRELRVPLPPGSEHRPGDRVRLSLAPARLLEASFLVYGIPLLALTVLPLLANWAWGPFGDGALTAIAAGSLLAAVLLGRRLLERRNCVDELLPSIAGRVSVTDR